MFVSVLEQLSDLELHLKGIPSKGAVMLKMGKCKEECHLEDVEVGRCNGGCAGASQE